MDVDLPSLKKLSMLLLFDQPLSRRFHPFLSESPLLTAHHSSLQPIHWIQQIYRMNVNADAITELSLLDPSRESEQPVRTEHSASMAFRRPTHLDGHGTTLAQPHPLSKTPLFGQIRRSSSCKGKRGNILYRKSTWKDARFDRLGGNVVMYLNGI
jgi:hypothetical protein